jgi:DNA-binding XRE family transcriptional regulator
LESFSTKRECESYVAALQRVQLAQLDKLEQGNKQRAAEGAAIVRRLREERGWTQGELAERARVTEATVAKVEAGDDVSIAVSAVNLAQALGLGTSDLSKYIPQFPRNITLNTKCWPDTIDPRGPKGQ